MASKVAVLAAVADKKRLRGQGKDVVKMTSEGAALAAVADKKRVRREGKDVTMASKGAALEAVADKKRVRGQGKDVKMTSEGAALAAVADKKRLRGQGKDVVKTTSEGAALAAVADKKRVRGQGKDVVKMTSEGAALATVADKKRLRGQGKDVTMASKGAALTAVADKKRARGQGKDVVASALADGNDAAAAPAAAEDVNGAGEDVEKADIKRAKKGEAGPAVSPMDVEVKEIVVSASIETVTVKDAGADPDEKGVAAEIKKGMEKNSPGGWKEGRKRKVAMLLAYCGANYQGMQRNPGAITIEGELEQALFRADAIAQCNFGDMRKVDWMRAARTDKGVSAIGQIVSARLVIDPPGLVERVNQHLPKDIRVFGYTRVTSNFNAKKMCDKRRYEYLVPVFAFDRHAHHDRETMNMWNERKENVRLQRIGKRKALEQMAAGSEAGAADAKDSTSEAPQPTAAEQVVQTVEILDETTTTVVEEAAEESPNGAEQEPYVFDEAKLQRLNKILSRYNGTHNFHNFTARIKPEDPSAKRYIISFEAGEVIEVQGVQFVPCTVVGQSFMLHQIRKMIGTAIAIMRGCVPETIIDFALKRDNDVNTPLAPELGLFLHECFYTAYNKKFSTSHEELSQKGYEEMIQKFKHEVVYPHVATTEAKDGTMALWLHSLNDRHYPYFETHREAAKM